MTRYLSQALGAEEPIFSQSIRQLEQASGCPNADIRLSTETMQRTRAKIAELGLDPQDTTGPELYGALHRRLEEDDEAIRRVLNIDDDATAVDILARIEQVANGLEVPRHCFVLKASVAKRLFKHKVPTRAMKQLGYRSVESMLKHEPVAQLFAAALIVESPAWQRAFREQYAKLCPSDFEMRPMQCLQPTSKKWNQLAANFVPTAKHNILTFKELGSIVILPMAQKVDGMAITSMLLVLNAMNDIRAYSSYIKLQQVKSRFGRIVQEASVGEPQVSAQLAGQPVMWRTIHRYYARFQEAYHPEVFEPHVQPEDLTWHRAEDILAQIEPRLAFWQDTQHLALLHNEQPVSFNMLDVALSYCNHLPFKDRIVHFVRDNLWHELMLKYLNQHNLEEAVQRQLAGELVADSALALAE